MRIAVIGSGISGMVAAYHLSREHEVTVFEAGGHRRPHPYGRCRPRRAPSYAVDTGFIVYNDWTYPNFIELLEELDVAWQPSHELQRALREAPGSNTTAPA